MRKCHEHRHILDQLQQVRIRLSGRHIVTVIVDVSAPPCPVFLWGGKGIESTGIHIGDAVLLMEVGKVSQKTLTTMDKKSRSSVEMNDPDSRPEIAETIPNMVDYDTVFIGFPIWWYVAPHIIHTFVESYDFSGKTLVPFATSGGSGMGKTVDELRKLCPNADWKAGKLINGVSDQAIAAWAAKFS